MGVDPVTASLITGLAGPALGGLFGGGGASLQERESFSGSSVDPETMLGNATGGIQELLRALGERVNRPIDLTHLRPSSDFPTFTGGGLPMPIGLSGQDTVLDSALQRPGLGLDLSKFTGPSRRTLTPTQIQIQRENNDRLRETVLGPQPVGKQPIDPGGNTGMGGYGKYPTAPKDGPIDPRTGEPGRPRPPRRQSAFTNALNTPQDIAASQQPPTIDNNIIDPSTAGAIDLLLYSLSPRGTTSPRMAI